MSNELTHNCPIHGELTYSQWEWKSRRGQYYKSCNACRNAQNIKSRMKVMQHLRVATIKNKLERYELEYGKDAVISLAREYCEHEHKQQAVIEAQKAVVEKSQRQPIENAWNVHTPEVGAYIVTMQNYFTLITKVGVAVFDNGWHTNQPHAFVVIAWMPLPEAYQAKV